jgi:hypothetical protein
MRKRPFTTGFRILLTAFVFSGASAAHADPVPLPKADYEAKAKLLNEGTLFIRHSNGKMRIEMQMPQFKEPAVGFIDLSRKRMVLMLPIPGIQDSAIEVEFGDDATFGQVLGEAQQTSQQRVVAGESCAVWKIVSSNENKAAACLTSDYIVLRTQATIEGKTRTVFEVTELKRQPQNAANLEVPSNVNVMKLPKGLKGIPGFPRH